MHGVYKQIQITLLTSTTHLNLNLDIKVLKIRQLCFGYIIACKILKGYLLKKF